jgi:hypothetical protein
MSVAQVATGAKQACSGNLPNPEFYDDTGVPLKSNGTACFFIRNFICHMWTYLPEFPFGVIYCYCRWDRKTIGDHFCK